MNWVFDIVVIRAINPHNLDFFFSNAKKADQRVHLALYVVTPKRILRIQIRMKLLITHLWHTIEVRTKETNRKERTIGEKAKRPSFQNSAQDRGRRQ